MHKKGIIFVSLWFLFVLCAYTQALADQDIDETCTLINDDIEGSCYLADDFGFSTGVLKVDSRKNEWVKFDPTLYTKGNKGESKANNIALKIEGGWRPWGKMDIIENCLIDPCVESREQGCYPDGQKVNIGEEQKNIPCCIDNGYGLYGVIAFNGQGGAKNPNNYGDNLPPDDFATFRIAPLKIWKYDSDTSDSAKKITVKEFVLKHIDIWDEDKKEFVKKTIPQNGTLYFKIVDSHYDDNQGSYNIVITNGAYAKQKGFTEKLIDFFMSTFHKVSDIIYKNIVKDSGFRAVLRAILALFMTFTVIFFMIGLIEINQTELVVRLFKIGVIATLISDTTLNTIPTFFDALVQGSIDISNVIMKSSMYDPKTHRELLPFPTLSTVFSAYDGVIEMVTSKVFNVKIWSLLFTSKFYLIIGIYVCVIMMFIGMLRSLVQYIMSFFLLALLIIMLPIFLATILFKKTIHLFENWLGQFIASCLMIIVVTTTVALMLSLIITQMQDLLHYTVCWKSIWKWKILGITIIDFKFWKPDDWTQFSNTATALRFFYVLISCILFRVYMDYVPELVDALSGAARRPLSGMYMGSTSTPGIMKSFENFMKEVYNTDTYKALDKAILSPVKQGVMKRLSPVYYIDKAASKLGMEKGKIMKGVSKGYKGISEVGKLWDNFVSNPTGDLGVINLAKEKDKGDKAWKDFEKQHGKYGYKLIGKGVVGGAQLAWEGGKLAGKGGKLVRKGIGELWERRKPMDQRNRELMRKMLDEDKVILDGRVQALDERYEQLKNEKAKLTPESSKEDLEKYRNALEKFETDRELVKQELSLYKDQERVIDGKLSQYEIQEGLNQIKTEVDKRVLSMKQKREDFTNLQKQLDKPMKDLEERRAKLEEKRINLEGKRAELEEQKKRSDQEMEELAKKDPLSAGIEKDKFEKDYGLKKRELDREDKDIEVERIKLDDDYKVTTGAYKMAHDEFTQEVEKAKSEIDNLQFVYDEQKAELDQYKQEFEDKWSTQDLAKDILDREVPHEEVEEKHSSSEKIKEIEETVQKSEKEIERLEKLQKALQKEARKIK